MSLRRTPLALGEYYHLYSRGVDKRSIFLDEEDKKRFIRLLFLCNGSAPIVYREIKNMPLAYIDKGETQTAIGAYCLMSNHFHLLVRETQEGGITRFMSKLLTAYSSYFNKKYERTGALFGSEFRSEHLNNDEYLKYIFSYIHLNPVRKLGLNKEETEKFLNYYSDSSYLDYVGGEREESLILNKLAFPEYFLNPDEFKKNLLDWVEDQSYPQFT